MKHQALAHVSTSHEQAAVRLAVRGPHPELGDVIDKGRVTGPRRTVM